MERINREKEALYKIAASGRLEDQCECLKDRSEEHSYYIAKDSGQDCLVKYDFENLKELEEMLQHRSEILGDDEVKKIICVAAFKMKHLYDEIKSQSEDTNQELPVFIYNM